MSSSQSFCIVAVWRSSRRALAVGLFMVAAMAVPCVVHADDSDIASLIATAKEKFTPVTPEQVAAAKSDLQSRAAALERYLHPSSSNGQRWLKYLGWEAFQQQLGAEKPEFEPLVATYGLLNKDNAGLELKPFREVSTALRHYIDLAAMSRQENQAETYGKQLDGLATELAQYDSSASVPTASAIGRRLDLVAGLGQAEELVTAIRSQYAQPNAFLKVSADLLRAAVDKPISRQDPVTDVILGTRIRGQGYTTGNVNLTTIPNDTKAVLKLTTDGHVVSRNLGYNGPAVIRSTGFTDFDATQLVEFSDKSFRAFTPQVAAQTSSRIHSVNKAGGGLGKRIVANVGMQKAHEKQGQANRIAAQHAEVRIARRISDEIDSRLAKAWTRYQNDYRLPLERRGEGPAFARFSTTADGLAYETTQASRGQLGAATAPPESPAGADLVLRLHETAINNYVAAILGGATLSETKPGEGTKADVKLPPFIKDAWKNRMDGKADEGDFEPWSLTFRRDRPISAAFVDGRVKLTIHVANLKSGDDVFDRWDVTATYVAEVTNGGVKLHREGELEVLPTGFDPAKGQLSSRQVAVRRNLTKVLTERSDKGRGIPQSIQIDAIEPSDEWAHVGTLAVKDFVSGAGWLTVAWNRK